jgi:hypothetical protein
MKVTYLTPTAEIPAAKGAVLEEHDVGDFRVKYHALEINPGLNPGIAVSRQCVGKPKADLCARGLGITGLPSSLSQGGLSGELMPVQSIS